LTATLSPPDVKRERFGLGTFALVLAGLAAAAPTLLGPGALRLVGTLLMVAGLLEVLQCFRRARQDVLRSAYASAGLTFLMGLLVLSAPALAETALTLLLGAAFVIDTLQRAVELRRSQDRRTALTISLAVAGNVAMALLLLVLWRRMRADTTRPPPMPTSLPCTSSCASTGSRSSWPGTRTTSSSTSSATRPTAPST